MKRKIVKGVLIDVRHQRGSGYAELVLHNGQTIPCETRYAYYIFDDLKGVEIEYDKMNKMVYEVEE